MRALLKYSLGLLLFLYFSGSSANGGDQCSVCKKDDLFATYSNKLLQPKKNDTSGIIESGREINKKVVIKTAEEVELE